MGTKTDNGRFLRRGADDNRRRFDGAHYTLYLFKYYNMYNYYVL